MNLDSEIFDDGKNVPVPPPRRNRRLTMKKSATLPAAPTTSHEKSEKIIKNGFKDIFGDESVPQESTADVKSSEGQSKTKRSKVAHRKIQRLLSGSSDPGSTNDSEDAEKLALSPSNDKKLFFLMNMLHDEINKRDEKKYTKNEIIVDEFNIITKRKPRKISQDDSQIQSLVKPASFDPPKKPERDFSKYQKPSENDSSFSTVEIEKENKKLSIDDMSTSSEIGTSHKRKSGANNLTPLVMQNNVSTRTKQNRPPPLNITITKPVEDRETIPQTAPILTQVIVDEMMKKAYGLQSYHPEDFTLHNLDDGSSDVTPTSKLMVRKLSVGRKISSCSTPSIDNDNGDFLIAANTSNSPTTPPLKSPTFMASKNVAMSDFLEQIYKENPKIMNEFQSYLEVSLLKNPVVNVTNEKAYVEEKGIQAMNINDNEENLKQEVAEDTKNSTDDDEKFQTSDEEESDEQQETIGEIAMIPRNKFPKYHSARRESIEDVDNWFTRHLDIEEKKSNYENIPDSPPVQTSYDTQKIFPFGKAITNRRGSVSDEFFSDLPPVVCFNEMKSEEVIEESDEN